MKGRNFDDKDLVNVPATVNGVSVTLTGGVKFTDRRIFWQVDKLPHQKTWVPVDQISLSTMER